MARLAPGQSEAGKNLRAGKIGPEGPIQNYKLKSRQFIDGRRRKER